MHSRDITTVIVLLWFNIVHYSSLFQGLLSSLLQLKILHTSLLTFLQILVNASRHSFCIKKMKVMVPHTWVILHCLKTEISITLHCQLCLTCYIAVRTNQELFKEHPKYIVTMKMWMVSLRKEAIHVIDKSKLFTVSNDEWNTKEDTGKFMKTALYLMWNVKRHFLDWSNIIQWKISL